MKLVTTRYWQDVEFNGCMVKTDYKPCLDNNYPYDDYDIVHEVSSYIIKS